MFTTVIHGFLLTVSAMCVIGPQNIFVIRQSAIKSHALAAVIVSALCDVLLIMLGGFGVSQAIEDSIYARLALSSCGALFLGVYGINLALRNEDKPLQKVESERRRAHSIKKIILLALGFSLLNPGVYIDTLVILGSFAGRLESADRQVFVFSCCLASCFWFSALALGAHYFSRLSAAKTIGNFMYRVLGVYVLICAFWLPLSTL
jgi:L-lysine exporter family protein LysE/ArgO